MKKKNKEKTKLNYFKRFSRTQRLRSAHLSQRFTRGVQQVLISRMYKIDYCSGALNKNKAKN